MSGFTELTRSAAVGVNTRPLTADALEPELREALAGAPSSGPGLALDAAAGYATAHRAALPSPEATPLGLPPRTLRPVSNGLAALIRHQFDSSPPAHQAETLAALVARGLTVTPDLLLWAMRVFVSGDHSALVLDLMDERARALFAGHRQWGARIRRFSPEGPGRRAWGGETPEDRIAYLTWLRERDPAAALGLLSDGSWQQFSPQVRAGFIEALSTGLSPDDEPFLEDALESPDHVIRAAAARQLFAIPGSGLVRRAEALVRAHVTVHKRLLRRPQLICTPVAKGEAPERDWFDPGHRQSPPVARLLTAIERVPPHRRGQVIGLSGTELVEAEASCKGKPLDLVEALSASARIWHDTALAEALRQAAPDRPETIGALDEASRERLLVDSYDPPALTAFARLRPAWPVWLPAAFSLTVADAVVLVAGQPDRDEDCVDWASSLACCAPEAIPEVLARLEQASPLSRKQTDAVTGTSTQLRLRHDIIRAITEETP